MLWVSPEGPRWGQTHARSAATCAPHLEHQSREVIALTATGLLGMAAPGQIQLTVVSLADRGRSHGIRYFKLDAWRSRRPTPPGEAPATGLAAGTLNPTRHLAAFLFAAAKCTNIASHI